MTVIRGMCVNADADMRVADVNADADLRDGRRRAEKRNGEYRCDDGFHE